MIFFRSEILFLYRHIMLEFLFMVVVRFFIVPVFVTILSDSSGICAGNIMSFRVSCTFLGLSGYWKRHNYIDFRRNTIIYSLNRTEIASLGGMIILKITAHQSSSVVSNFDIAVFSPYHQSGSSTEKTMAKTKNFRGISTIFQTEPNYSKQLNPELNRKFSRLLVRPSIFLHTS